MTLEPGKDLAERWRKTFLRREALKRVGFTLAALVVYRLGLLLPAPGIDAAVIPGLDGSYFFFSGSALHRVSIFALGLGPIFSILVAAEVLKLASPRLRHWLTMSVLNRDVFNRNVLLAGLALTALQAYGVAIGLSEIKSYGTGPLVPDPGLAFQVSFVLSVIAGTAFLAWHGDQITRHGIGNGFWILLLAPAVADLARFPGDVYELVRTGQIPPEAAILLMLIVLAAIGLIAMLHKALRPVAEAASGSKAAYPQRLFARSDSLLWPPIIATSLAGIGVLLPLAIQGWLGGDGLEQPYFGFGSVSFWALAIGLIFLLTFLRAATGQDPGLTPIRAFIVAAAMSIICIAVEILDRHFGIPFMASASFGAITLVCLLALPENLADYFPEAPPPPLDAEET